MERQHVAEPVRSERDVAPLGPPRAPRGDQAAVVRFLASPAAHAGAMPQHIETHLSHVFLVGDRAFKLKKAIRWSMVDYATLERRERFCRAELSANSVAAPLYVGVVPVTKTSAGFAIGGGGAVVDWLVEMRRFPAGDQLDVMVDNGTVTPAIVDATADAIAAMHATAPVVRVADAATRVAAVTAQLRDDLGRRIGGIGPDMLDAWVAVVSARLDARRLQLGSRGRHGFVRRCHGDLHLSNICLWHGVPTPFDAIEFSDDLATIDVLHDLAFAIMDLEGRGRTDLAARMLSRYLEATRDYSGLAVLPIFVSQRAMVRALTRVSKGLDASPWIALAVEAACRQEVPRLIAVGGPSGSGKSTVARAIAPRLRAVVIRSDAVRKRLMGRTPEERLGPCGYVPSVSEATYRRMRTDARRALAAGASVILDATFFKPQHRGLARALADDLGVPFGAVWLDAPGSVLRDRLAGRGPDASDADGAVLAAQLAHGAGPLNWPIVDAEGGTDAVVARALAALG